jgi:hypothetical protein
VAIGGSSARRVEANPAGLKIRRVVRVLDPSLAE